MYPLLIYIKGDIWGATLLKRSLRCKILWKGCPLWQGIPHVKVMWPRLTHEGGMHACPPRLLGWIKVWYGFWGDCTFFSWLWNLGLTPRLFSFFAQVPFKIPTQPKWFNINYGGTPALFFSLSPNPLLTWLGIARCISEWGQVISLAVKDSWFLHPPASLTTIDRKKLSCIIVKVIPSIKHNVWLLLKG